MPRLQILQHKSYHPYLEKNKQRVREDEAKALAEETLREQKRVDAESEFRLNILRNRAGSPSLAAPLEDDNLPSTSSTRQPGTDLVERRKKELKREKKARDRLDFDFPTASSTFESQDKGKPRERERERDAYDVDGTGREAWDSGGHVNLFADLERAGKVVKPIPTMEELAKKKREQELDKFTMYLGRPERETKPWYTDRELKGVEEKEIGEEAEERRERERRRDMRAKDRYDPLTHVNTLLKSHPSQTRHHKRHPPTPADPQAARQERELSERQRALALIAQSKAPSRAWDETPSSVGGGRSWAEDLERQKDRAGRRFFGDGPGGGGSGWERRGKVGGRTWEV